MYLIVDTETTGKPANFRAPFTDLKNWPRVVQIAWLEFDAKGNRIGAQDLLVKPVGFEIPAAATRIHGITTQRAKTQGVPLERALSIFSTAAAKAQVIVAHNVDFDVPIVRAELLRMGLSDCLDGKAFTCTMQASTQYCRIPGGSRGYKWPSLSELYRALFRMELQEAHNAAVDVDACARCFFELRTLGVLAGPTPVAAEESAAYEVDAELQDLFDSIFAMAQECPWFNTAFVDDVHAQYLERRRLSDRQRTALQRIHHMLEEKTSR